MYKPKSRLSQLILISELYKCEKYNLSQLSPLLNSQVTFSGIVCMLGMLTAGMSTRAVARELNVHCTTISCLQRHFRQFGSTSNRPHNRRPSVTTPAQDLHIQRVHQQDHLRPATWTAAATIGLINQNISAQTVRIHLREAHLHARRPHRGLDLTAVRCCNRLEWANAHTRCCLACWRGVFFTDESRFSLFRADGRHWFTNVRNWFSNVNW